MCSESCRHVAASGTAVTMIRPLQQRSADYKTSRNPTSLRRNASQRHFHLEKVCQGYVPSNTSKATRWSLCVFNTWREGRNECSPELCPENLLKEPNAELLKYWLARFVEEARRDDSQPPATITASCLGYITFPSLPSLLESFVQTL